MSTNHRDEKLLSFLATMPFLDRIELSQVSRKPNQRVYDDVAVLQEKGLVDSVGHGTPLLTPTRRFYVTKAGLGWLACVMRMDLEKLLRTFPVSRRWQRLLLERLDAVGVIYRVAANVAMAAGGFEGLEWYRSQSLDCVMFLPGGKTLGILRQGATSDRTGFSKRVWRLMDGPSPTTILVLTPDEVRYRHTRRLMGWFHGIAFTALESEAACAAPEDRIWRVPSHSTALGMSEVLKYSMQGSGIPLEDPLQERLFPDHLAVPQSGLGGPDYLLPVMLKPGEKRVLDILADWPWITAQELEAMLGVSKARVSQLLARLIEGRLVTRIPEGRRRHLALSDQGLAVVARRDRTSVGRLRHQWSVEPVDPGVSFTWCNVSGRRSRLLARNMVHTEAVHRFMAEMSRQARAQSYEVVQYDPPHRASRHFPHRDKHRSIHPDAFGMLRGGDQTFSFFLEWERRAVRPGTMAARLAPYLRYYSSKRPLDDHGAWPLVLIVFDDDLVESNFHGVARREMERARVDVPLWVSYTEILEKVGPWGRHGATPTYLSLPSPSAEQSGPGPKDRRAGRADRNRAGWSCGNSHTRPRSASPIGISVPFRSSVFPTAGVFGTKPVSKEFTSEPPYRGFPPRLYSPTLVL